MKASVSNFFKSTITQAGLLHIMHRKIRTTALLGLSLVALLLGSDRLGAVPVTYSFDDPGLAGTGTFTLDVGSTLGTYWATGVSGGPGTVVGPWASVVFSAEAGLNPTLKIYDTASSDMEYIGFAIGGGGGVLPTSNAQAEWANFILQFEASGTRITAQTPPTGVPEGGPSLILTATILGGLMAWPRVRSRLSD
ncbi:MAG: hypothetical protein AB9869_13060 [Verrucomicrobiia bacterium]